MQKTNAVRMLEKAKIPFTVIEYEVDENDLSGVHIARQTAQEEERFSKRWSPRVISTDMLFFVFRAQRRLTLKKRQS